MKKLCMILPLALILCFMVGCQDKEAMAEVEEQNEVQDIIAKGDMVIVRTIFATAGILRLIFPRVL
jgi:uncharacterized protein YcfL